MVDNKRVDNKPSRGWQGAVLKLFGAVSEAAYDAEDHFGWVACDNRTTRAVAKILREDYRIPRTSIKAQAYWAEGA